MKTKNLFLATMLVAFGAVNAQNNVVVLGTQAAPGYENIIIGSNAGLNATSALSANTFVGSFSGYYNNEGNHNSFFGYSSGSALIKGNSNTFIGFRSGTGVTYGNGNTFLGSVYSNNPSIKNSIILADGETNQRFYIDDKGNAGIGLGNNIIPGNKLEIKSDNTNTSGLRFTNLTSLFTPTTTASKFLTVDLNGDVILKNISTSGSGTDTSIYNTNGAIVPANFGNRVVALNNNNLVFNTSGTDENRNKVYIGDSPSFPMDTGNYKLYVEGGILTEKVKVAVRTSLNWADYVFANDYKLMPLNEVETYIKTNKHLPGVSSADKLVNEGLDLAEMQAKQMEKIEELTLYAIEQNKKIEKQEKEIEELKVLVKTLMDKK